MVFKSAMHISLYNNGAVHASRGFVCALLYVHKAGLWVNVITVEPLYCGHHLAKKINRLEDIVLKNSNHCWKGQSLLFNFNRHDWSYLDLLHVRTVTRLWIHVDCVTIGGKNNYIPVLDLQHASLQLTRSLVV